MYVRVNRRPRAYTLTFCESFPFCVCVCEHFVSSTFASAYFGVSFLVQWLLSVWVCVRCFFPTRFCSPTRFCFKWHSRYSNSFVLWARITLRGQCKMQSRTKRERRTEQMKSSQQEEKTTATTTTEKYNSRILNEAAMHDNYKTHKQPFSIFICPCHLFLRSVFLLALYQILCRLTSQHPRPSIRLTSNCMHTLQLYIVCVCTIFSLELLVINRALIQIDTDIIFPCVWRYFESYHKVCSGVYFTASTANGSFVWFIFGVCLFLLIPWDCSSLY